jgi:hypothetical protein
MYELIYFLDTIFYLCNLIFCFIYAVKFNNFLLIFLSALSEYKLGLIAHEGCHKAISKWYGKLYDLVFSSSEMWIQKHNKTHHIYIISFI